MTQNIEALFEAYAAGAFPELDEGPFKEALRVTFFSGIYSYLVVKDESDAETFEQIEAEIMAWRHMTHLIAVPAEGEA